MFDLVHFHFQFKIHSKHNFKGNSSRRMNMAQMNGTPSFGLGIRGGYIYICIIRNSGLNRVSHAVSEDVIHIFMKLF